MKRFVVDPRDGGIGNSISLCNTCCCVDFSMKPGETDKMVIGYAPWSVPLGGMGLIEGGTEFDIQRIVEGCSEAAIDGFAPPAIVAPSQTVVLNTLKQFTIDALPANNAFTWRVIPSFAPKHGMLKQTPSNGNDFEYTPNAGYVGYDEFWIEATDAQGRKTVSRQPLAIGNPSSPAPVGKTGLYVSPSQVVVSSRLHAIEFPISLLPDARPCEVFKLTVRQSARDCDYTYTHSSCYQVHVGRC